MREESKQRDSSNMSQSQTTGETYPGRKWPERRFMDPNSNFYKPLAQKKVLPFWIESWLFLSGIICLLDVGFTMFRPHTTRGGFLETFYYGWNIYADVDKRYADTADVVTCATGRVMLLEILMNFIAIYLVSYSHKNGLLSQARTRSRHALLTTFTTSAFVFWKTVWYLVMYIQPPAGSPSYIFENRSNLRIFLVFWIPNGCWVVFPFLVMIALWNRLAIEEPKEEENSLE